MLESFKDDCRRSGKERKKPIRLFLEELEGRCLLSTGINPIGGVVVGPDGNLWFPEPGKIGQLNPANGVIKEFQLPAGPSLEGEIIFDKNGNLWFSRVDRIDRMNSTTGAVQEFLLPQGESAQSYIAADGDGRIWFSDLVKVKQSVWIGSGKNVLADEEGIGVLDPNTGEINQAFTSFDSYGGPHVHYLQVVGGPEGTILMAGTWWDDTAAPFLRWLVQIDGSGNKQASSWDVNGRITVGPDGSIWYPAYYFPQVVRVDPTTRTEQIIGPDLGGGPPFLSFASLTIGQDGNVYGLEANVICQINVSTGALQEFIIPGYSGGLGIAAGQDGNIWLSEPDAIGQFNPATEAFEFFITTSKSGNQGNSNAEVSNTAIAADGANVSATASIDFKAAVAMFTPQSTIALPGAAYQATVEWGDGAISNLALTVSENAAYDVTAGHTYQKPGTYSIKVSLGNYNPANPLGDNVVTVFSTASVQASDFNPFS